MNKHTFVRCVICDTPYADEKEPFLCERCQANGMAAEAIKRLNTETDNAAAQIAALEAALAKAKEHLELWTAKEFVRDTIYLKRRDAARAWLERNK
jgi:endogenous inhibitor of DNA gyrase (YacG/DUF329 family)